MFKFLEKTFLRLQKNALHFEVVQNAGVSFLVKVLSMLTVLLLDFVIARILRFEQFGVYTFVLVWIQTLTFVGTLGFNTSSIRFVSDYYSNQEWSLLKGFLKYSLVSCILASFILLAISFGVIKGLESWELIESSIAQLFYLALPLIPFFSLLFVQGGILRGGKFLTLALFFQNVFVYALLLLFILAGFYLKLFPINVFSIFVLFYVALIIALISQQIFIRRKFGIYKLEVNEEIRVSDWIKTSFSMMLSSSFMQLINRLDIIAIGIFISPTATGVYAIALRLSRLINIGLQITNESSAHLFKPLFSRGERDKLQRIVFTTAKITLITTIPIIAVLMLFPTFILSQYGDDFASGRPLLQILLIGQIINAISGPNGLLLNMTAYQDLLARIFTITFFIDVVLLIILLPLLGVLGAAIATSGSIIFRNLVTIFYVWKNLKVNPTVVSVEAWQRATI